MRGVMPAHLVIRGGVYYFRRAVPRHLVVRFGRAELKYSLQTRDVIRAQIRCQTYSKRFDALVATVEQTPALRMQNIESLIRTYFAGLLSEAEELVFLMRDDDSVDIEDEITEAEAQLKIIQKQIGQGKIDAATKYDAKMLLEQTGAKDTKLGGDDFEKLCGGILRAQAEKRRIIGAMLRGAYGDIAPKDPLLVGVKSPGLPLMLSEGSADATDTLGAIIEKYFTFKISQDWVPKTANENRRILGWFRDGVGSSRKIKDVTIEDVRDFRDLLLKLPKNFSLMTKYAGKSLAETAEMGSEEQCLSPGTLQKYFSCVRAFFQWAESDGYLDVSPAMKIKAGKKSNQYEARKPFSPGQLKGIFFSPQYVGHRSLARRSTPGDMVVRDGKYWVPILGLYTGARLGEIVQLLVSDVREEGGIDYFDINRDEAGGKSLKTSSSQRVIPVHPELVRFGFMEYVENRRGKGPSGRLFSEIKQGKDGSYSHNFSKYFGRYLKQVGVKTNKTTFHSFRHNFTDALRNGAVEDSRMKSLLGHSDKSVTAEYGSGGPPLKVLAEDMKKVVFDVELSHLRM